MATTTYYTGQGNIWQYLYKIALNWKQGTSEGFVGCNRPSDSVYGLYDLEPWNRMEDLEKQSSGNAEIGSKLSIFRPMWASNLTNDIEKLQGASSMPLEAMCVIA